MSTKIIAGTLDRLRQTANKISFLGPALARLTVGLVFIGTGWGSCTRFPT